MLVLTINVYVRATTIPRSRNLLRGPMGLQPGTAGSGRLDNQPADYLYYRRVDS
jgi:hypothetical protein